MKEKQVLIVTAKGNAELMAAGSALPSDELKVLVLVDGIASVGEIAADPQHGVFKESETGERKEKGKITVLAIEDDPALTKLPKMYLQMADIVVRIAATRADINKAGRSSARGRGMPGRQS